MHSSLKGAGCRGELQPVSPGAGCKRRHSGPPDLARLMAMFAESSERRHGSGVG
jgi:hypothetical protein